MSTVIVTGGCGYIGSHTIIELLQTTDFDVVSIDSCINSSEETLSNIETITGKRIANYKVDLCNFEDFKSVMTKIENPIGIIRVGYQTTAYQLWKQVDISAHGYYEHTSI